MKMIITPEQKSDLLSILKLRFEQNMNRHLDLDWNIINERLENNPGLLWSLNEMEKTGGAPDVIGYDSETDKYVFFDCSEESPIGRRSLCYDHEALESRKQNKPVDSAVAMATDMGISLLNENQYLLLQQYGTFDSKTSSWLEAPVEIRKLGGSIFGDKRFGRVFIYHNGAESYYGGRGFRGCLRV